MILDIFQTICLEGYVNFGGEEGNNLDSNDATAPVFQISYTKVAKWGSYAGLIKAKTSAGQNRHFFKVSPGWVDHKHFSLHLYTKLMR